MLSNPVLTDLRNLNGLLSSISIYQSDKFSTYLKKGSTASYSATKQFSNGVAYEQKSTGALAIPTSINTALNFDAGRVVPTYTERFEITGLNGNYANGNGTYIMSTNYRNDKITYKNKNDWAIWYDSDKDEWVMTNALVKHPSRSEYEFILRNNSDDPLKGTYTSLDGTQKGYTPSSIGNQVVVSVPVFSYSSPIVKIATCNTHTLFLDKSNTAWAVGNNVNAQLGDGTHVSTTLPIKISKNDVMDIAVTDFNSYITKLDGSLWVAGQNTNGILFVDNAKKRNYTGGFIYKNQYERITSLTKVTPGGQDNIILQVRGYDGANSYILKYENVDGVRRKNLYSAGNNYAGQLVMTDHYYGTAGWGRHGIDLVTSDSFRNEIKFDCGHRYIVWIRQGELYGAGDNSLGQLGPDDPIINNKPFRKNNYMASSLNTPGTGIARPKQWGNVDVIKVRCGTRFTVVLLADKTLWAAGDRTHNNYPLPEAVAADKIGVTMDKVHGSYVANRQFKKLRQANVKDFELGDNHMIVLTEDGKLLSSGDNRLGQCGLGAAGTTKRRYDGLFDAVLVDGKPVESGVTYIHANGNSTFFVKDDELYALGHNKYGNLGDGSTSNIVKSTKVYPTG